MAEPIPYVLFRERVLALYTPPLRARSTHAAMRRALDLLGRVEGVTSTADLTTETLARYVASRADGNTNTTISQLRALKAACNLAVAEGWLDRNPCASRMFRLRPSPPIRRTHFAVEEIGRLLEHLEASHLDWKGGRLHALVATVAYTGLRKREALYLQVPDVDLGRGLLVVVARAGNRLKTQASARVVPIPPELETVLRGWLPRCHTIWVFPNLRGTGPWTGGPPGYKPLDQLQAAGRRVGIEGLTLHALRHTLATHLAGRWGLSVEQIRQILGHSDSRTTLDHYIHRDPGHLRDAVRDVSFRVPPPAGGG